MLCYPFRFPGRKWEDKVAAHWRKEGYDVYRQIVVRDAKTAKKLRLDSVVADRKTGKIVQIYDAKASDTAGFTPNQKKAYPEWDSGGQFIPVGKKAAKVPGMTVGKPMSVPGGRIRIHRPSTLPGAVN